MTLSCRTRSYPLPMLFAFGVAAFALVLRVLVPAGFMPATTKLELSLCLPGSGQYSGLHSFDSQKRNAPDQATSGQNVLVVELERAPDSQTAECPLCMLLAQPYFPADDAPRVAAAQYAAIVTFASGSWAAPVAVIAGPPVGPRAPPVQARGSAELIA